MKERPILFIVGMVRAILEGRKTHTRRVMKPQPPAGNYRYDGVGDVEKDLEDWDPECHWLEVLDENGEYAERYWKAGRCPYGVPGDRLWCSVRPSIHMPSYASRITLEVAGVRAERLQDISEEDAKAEGFESAMEFTRFWDYIAKPGAKWADNPWVWVIEFWRLENA